MRSIFCLAVAVLLVVSVGINVAEAADIIPCQDAVQTVSMLAGSAAMLPGHANSPADGAHGQRSPLHCAVVSPFATAILAQRPAAPYVTLGAIHFALPANVVSAGISPVPMHGPPRS